MLGPAPRRGPKENYHRPAADALFRSAAVAHGPAAVGVVLTGARDDGTAGLIAIRRRGGTAVVQDPDDALFRWMPESALRYADVDHQVPLAEMAPLLARLCGEPTEKRGVVPVPEDMEFEARITGIDPAAIDSGEHAGEISGFTCPECTGRSTRSRRAASCATDAGSATPTPPTACSTERTAPSKTPSTPPSTP